MLHRDHSGRTQPDRCPGVVAVHQAADGGLARIRLPGGLLRADQLGSLAAASAELGDGNLELTSRANLQIRALGPEAPSALSDRLHSVGLLPSITHERVRNILASPLSGLDEPSLYDVLPAVAELDQRLCAEPRLAELPGRFLFALDDGRGDLAGLGADVGIQALPAGRVALLLAGTDTGVRADPGELVELMLGAAEAFLAERAAQESEAWRLAELEAGATRVLDRLDPTRRGRVGAERLVVSGPVQVGRHAQPDGRSSLVVTIPLGSLGPEQAAALVESARAGSGDLRVTPWRSVVLCGLPAEAIEGVLVRLETAGLSADPRSGWVGVTACTGQPGCGKALADVRGDARRVTPVNRAGQRPVHWSGCDRRCGRPAGDFVDVVALGNGYLVDGSVTSGNDVGDAIAAVSS